MKNFKNNILFCNIAVLATLIMSLFFKKHFFIFGMLIVVNVLFSLNLVKIEKLKKDLDSFEIKSLNNKFFIYLTYISFILFFVLFVISYQMKNIEILVNIYVVYLIFWIFSKFTINFYTKDNLVISTNIYPQNSIKSITTKDDKHTDKISLTIYFYNNKQINIILNKKEFNDIKSKMNLYGKIKY